MAKYKNQEFLEAIGNRIDEIRIKKNITQEKLCDRMENGDVRHIGRIIRAETNFSASEIARFAYALGVHPRELMDFDFELNSEFIPPLASKSSKD